MSDGSIIFDTKVDNKELTAGLKEAKAQIKQVEAEIRNERKYIDSLYKQLSKSPNDSGIKAAIQQHEDAIQLLMNDWDALDQKISSIGGSLGEGGTERGLKSALSGILTKLKEFAKTSAEKHLGKFRNEAQKTTSASATLGKSIFSLGNMFKRMALRMAMRAVLSTVQSGFKNLILYSDAFNKSMSGLSASAGAFSNGIVASFVPLLNAVAPVLQKLIDYCTSAVNAISRLFSMLGGGRTYIKAIKQNKDLASSYKGVGSAAEEAKGQAASFDEFNVISKQDTSGSSGTGTDTMFDTEEIGETSELMNKLKSIFEDIRDIASTIAAKWKEAWDFNGNGLIIMETLGKIGNDILDTVKKITEATLEWAKNLDLVPLVTGLKDVLVAFEPIVKTVGNTIAWVWENAVLPFAKWVTESALPTFLQLVAAALTTLNPLMETVGNAIQWIFDGFLNPFASDIGDAIISIMEFMIEKFKGLANWIEKNNGIITDLIEIVGVAITIFAGAEGLIAVIGAVGAAFTALSLNSVTLIIAAIAAIIAIVIKASGGWTAFKQNVINVINAIVKAIVGAVKNANVVNAIVGAVKNAKTNIGNLKTAFSNLLSFITGTFTNGWRNAWNGIKSIFSGVFNSLGNIVKSALNAVIGRINSLSFTAPDWVPYYGGKRFGFSIPYLATGAYVPPNAGEFMAVLGDNKREGEFVAPESKLAEAVAEAVKNAGGGSRDEEILAALNTLISVVRAKPTGISKKQIGSAAVDYINEETIRTNNSPILV